MQKGNYIEGAWAESERFMKMIRSGKVERDITEDTVAKIVNQSEDSGASIKQ